MRALLVVAVVSVAMTSCSSHEPAFERDATPPPNTLAEAERNAAAAATLIERQAETLSVQSPESLANLARASALVFTVTSAPRMQSIARKAARRMLEGRVAVGGGLALVEFDDGPRPDSWVTSTGGLALLDVFRATRDEAFRQAAREATRAVASARLGWRRTAKGPGVVDRRSPDDPDVARTAQAALLMARAADEAGLPLGREARAAFRLVRNSQPAVGHWYSTVSGRQPQSLTAWSTTLLTVTSPLAEAQLGGIGGAGVPDLSQAVFTAEGIPRRGPLVETDREGLPLAMSVLQTWPDERYAARPYARALEAEDARELAAFGAVSQVGTSRLALAFARRAEVTLERSQSN